MKKNSETSRDRIISAAINVFYEMDFFRATTRAISKEANIAVGTLYKHFRSKEELLDSIATDKIRQANIGLQEHLIGVSGAYNKLKKVIWYYFWNAEREPKLTWVVYISMSRNLVNFPGFYKESRESEKVIREIIIDGQSHNEVRQDINIPVILHIFFGTIEHVVTDWLLHKRKQNPTVLADTLAQTLFTAVKTVEQDTVSQCPYVEMWRNSTS